MARALALAALADGRTSPNPLVGCVVLDANGELVGEGYHRQAGEPHAEVMALRRAGDRAQGGTLYVTLEPCCHHGRTPPCSEAVIAAGLRRVVIALDDPDPRVAGGGIAQLKAAGIEVISGVRQAEAAQQNRAFLHRLRTGRPWGLLKWAMSLDGRTALSNGASQWISSPPARSWVHQLRAGVDAVIVGGGTVRADNPLLTSRGQRNPEPLRVVLSRSLDLPKAAQLWDQTSAATLVAHGPEATEPNSNSISWGWSAWSSRPANQRPCSRPWPSAAATGCCGNAARSWRQPPWLPAACKKPRPWWRQRSWAAPQPARPWAIWASRHGSGDSPFAQQPASAGQRLAVSVAAARGLS